MSYRLLSVWYPWRCDTVLPCVSCLSGVHDLLLKYLWCWSYTARVQLCALVDDRSLSCEVRNCSRHYALPHHSFPRCICHGCWCRVCHCLAMAQCFEVLLLQTITRSDKISHSRIGVLVDLHGRISPATFMSDLWGGTGYSLGRTVSVSGHGRCLEIMHGPTPFWSQCSPWIGCS